MKTFKIPFSLLVWLIIAPVASAWAGADLPATGLPFAGLAVLPEPHLRLTDRNQADYDFGKTNLLDVAQVEHVFTLRNEGATPLKITQFQPSCHCTRFVLETIAGHIPAAADAAQPTLPPGQEMTVKVTVQLPGQAAGPLAQGVFVFAAGCGQPIARIHIVGGLESGLAITPARLDFGPMKPGETRSQQVAIKVDHRLVSGEILPPLCAQSDPGAGFTIKVVPAAEAAAGLPVPPLHTKTYLVTVQAALAGSITAQLYFAPLPPSEYKGTIPYEAAMTAFRGVTAVVSGQVTEK